MFGIHVIAYIWCSLCIITSLYIINLKRKSYSRSTVENNAEFRNLQRRFLFPYLVVLFSESLQAPYLYAFYYNFHFQLSEIAVFYVTGFISNIAFAFYYVHLSARYGRRSICILCIAAGCIGCMCKIIPSFDILLLGRIFDGIFTGLLTSPFQQWYIDEHQVSFDFPSEWTHSTFLILSFGSGFLSVFAGITSQIIVSISEVLIIPYLMSTVTLIVGGFFISLQWKENRSVDAPLPFRNVIAKALGVIRSNPTTLLLSVTTCFAEMASQMYAFVWAPLFIQAQQNEVGSDYALGIIYASFAASYLTGLLIFSSFATKYRSSRLLLLSLISAFLVFVVATRELPFIHEDWTSIRFECVYLCMVVFEIACGVYTPAIETLQSTILHFLPQRSAVLALIRLPLTFLLSLSIMVFFPTPGGEMKMMIFIVIQLFISALLSLLLDAVVINRGYEQDPDRFFLPRTSAGEVRQSENTMISF